jgi:cytoskeletal protein CcmA (bactofilin family)
MFRRKDNDPQPSGLAERPAESFNPQASDVKAPAEPDMPKRNVDIPTAPTGTTGGKGPITDAGGKRLIVGEGISLSGVITACDLLVVQGSVQVTLNETRAIEIAESGRFTEGKASVEEATISGMYEGELTVKNRLHIKSTGKVKGTIKCGEIQVDRGAQISGSFEMLPES